MRAGLTLTEEPSLWVAYVWVAYVSPKLWVANSPTLRSRASGSRNAEFKCNESSCLSEKARAEGLGERLTLKGDRAEPVGSPSV